jgi:phage baseplate assembly protein W
MILSKCAGFPAINTIMVTFIGFSTINSRTGSSLIDDVNQGRRTGTNTLEDKEIASRDLLNHFYTRKGERLGEPEFGSILPELVFEQLDGLTRQLADEDVRTIVSLDPRWKLIDYKIDINDHSLIIDIQLEYVPDLSRQELVLRYRAEEET